MDRRLVYPALRDKADDLSKQAEREYRARNAAMSGVSQALRDARDLLLVATRDNPKALGDFSYENRRPPRAKPKPNRRSNQSGFEPFASAAHFRERVFQGKPFSSLRVIHPFHLKNRP